MPALSSKSGGQLAKVVQSNLIAVSSHGKLQKTGKYYIRSTLANAVLSHKDKRPSACLPFLSNTTLALWHLINVLAV
jgi:hypothetical protein